MSHAKETVVVAGGNAHGDNYANQEDNYRAQDSSLLINVDLHYLLPR